MKKAFTMAIAVAGLWLPATSVGQTAAAVATARHHDAGALPHAGTQHHAVGTEHYAVGTEHHAVGTEHHAVVAQHHDAVTQQSSGTMRVVAKAVETRITPGRPYSAEAVTETVHVLGDGNRINRRSATKVYRDSEGRTRREVLAGDGSVRSIAISDPVSHTSYTLDPKTKTAFKGGGNVVMPLPTPGSAYTYTLKGQGEAHATAKLAEKLTTAARAGGSGGTGGVMTRTPAPDDPNVRKEELGPQNIEGVTATGTRTTTVIPAGEIGNAQEIRIVSEQWFSDELQVLVMTRHSDPRTGETTYRLRDILRAEPDPSLFTVPPDYSIHQRGVRMPE